MKPEVRGRQPSLYRATLEMRGLREPQAAGIDRHEKGPVARLERRGEDGFEFAARIGFGPACMALHARDGRHQCRGVAAGG